MNYSELSDFEINALVAKKSWVGCNAIAFDDSEKCYVTSSFGDLINGCYNPCNNPAHAWPIILENKISVIYNKYDELYTACCNYRHSWGCDFGDMVELDNDTGNENPLRAAMITFLKMSEA